jgi:hypothetical protein
MGIFKIRALTVRVWSAMPVLLILNIVVFSLFLSTAAEDLRVQYIPDDAYYYLSLARNFSSLGFWTFDSGVSTTSGFHLLFAYLLAGVYKLLEPDGSRFVIYGVILSSAGTIAALIVFWSWALRHRNILFLMFLTLLFTSQNLVYNAISVTEWSLTLLMAALYCVWLLARYERRPVTSFDALLLFTLGLLGSLARSDFGLLPFAMLVSVFTLHVKNTVKPILLPLWGFAGSLAGLIVLFTHNYIFTSEFLQSSAKMKAYWAQGSVPNYYIVPLMVGEIIGLAGLSFLALLIATAVLSKLVAGKESAQGRIRQNNSVVLQRHSLLKTEHPLLFSPSHNVVLLLLAGVVSILGYIWFYAPNPDVQSWYSANLIVPILMVVFAVSDYATVSIRNAYVMPVLSLLCLSVVILNVTKLYPLNSVNALWPHQSIMFQAGQHLNLYPLEARVGSWNAGIIGYYEGGNVVNLDGLVNNDIYDYVTNGSLPAYMGSRNIHYIIDFEKMITNEYLRMRGGYNQPDFLDDLKPQMVFDQRTDGWRRMTLYYIERHDH